MGRLRLSIEACVGRGGFGEVFRAHGPEGVVALKVLRADVDPSTQAVARLRDEARWMSMLDHPCLPRVHALGEVEGRVALISEFVEGDDLSHLLRNDTPPSIAAGVQIVAHVADALDAAWSRPVRGHPEPLRLVHRDIKPANVRVRPDGGVALLDLGIARTDALTRDAHTRSSGLIGSPGYMAPERFHGTPVHAADDMFGLGCVLYEILCGRKLLGSLSFPAYAGFAADPDRLQQHLQNRLQRLPGAVPSGLRDLLTQMLEVEPRARPTASQVYARCREILPSCPGPPLARWARGRDWPPPRALSSPWVGRTLTAQVQAIRPLARTASPRPWHLASLTLSGALAGGLAVWWLVGPPPTAPPPEPQAPEAATMSAPAPLTLDPIPLSLDLADPTPAPEPSAEPAEPDRLDGGIPSPPTSDASPPAPRSSTTPDRALVSVSRPSDVTEVHLMSGQQRQTLPARLPPGHYEVHAVKDGVLKHHGEVDLAGDGPWSLRCAYGVCVVMEDAP